MKLIRLLALALIVALLPSAVALAKGKKGHGKGDKPPKEIVKELKADRLNALKPKMAVTSYPKERPTLVTIQAADSEGLLPGPDAAGWLKIQAPPGGVVYGITPDPYIPNRVFAMAEAGLYRSIDDGKSWRYIPYLRGGYSWAPLGFVNGDPNRLYFGATDGLWKSTDGGDNWAPLNPTQIHLQVVAVAVSPADPNRILVAMTDWSTSTDQGLWLSTNGGANFTKVTDIGNNWVNPNCIAFAPSNPQVVWAMTWDNSIYTSYPATSPCLFKSTNGGSSWTLVPTGYIVDGGPIFVNPSDPNDVQLLGIVSTLGYQSSYCRVNSLGFGVIPSLGTDMTTFAVNPLNFEEVYSSNGWAQYLYARNYTTKEWIYSYAYQALGVMTSANGGVSATSMTSEDDGLALPGNPALKPFIGNIAVTGNGTVLIATRETAAGILRWDAERRRWEPSCAGMYHSVNGVKVSDINPLEAWATVWGPGLFHTADGGAHWTLSQPWDPMNRDTLPVRHRSGSSVEYAWYYQYNGQLLTGSIQTGPLALSTYYGTAVDLAGTGVFQTLPNPDYPVGSSQNSYYQFHINYRAASCTAPPHPVLESRLTGLYSNCDGFLTPTGLSGIKVNQAWEDPADQNHLLAATTGSGLQESLDGGASWAPRTGGLTETTAISFAVDPADPRHWFAGMWDPVSRSGDLYQTTDGGTTWVPTNLWVAIKSVDYTPGTPGDIWAISATVSGPGAYHSTNNGITWISDWSAGPSECGSGLFGFDIGAARPVDTWVASQGGGVFRKESSPPSPPIGLTVADPGTGTSLNPAWTANPEPDISGYKVLWAEHGKALVNGIDAPINSATISGLQQYRTYDVAVIAINNLGQISPMSAIVTQTVTCGGAVPGTPANVSPANNAVNVDSLATLQWAASSGASRYRVQVAKDPDFASLVLDVQDIPTTSYTIGDSTTGTVNNPYWIPYLQCAQYLNPYNPTYYAYGQYWWRVLAGDTCGYSPAASSNFHLTTTPLPEMGIPALLSPPNGATGLGLSATLQWNALAGATKFRVQLSDNPWFWGPLADVETAGTSLPVNLPYYCRTYYWRVYPGTGCGFSVSPSSVWHFATQNLTPAVAPSPLFPPDGALNQPVDLTLQWGEVTGGGDYRLQVSTNSGFTSIIVDVRTSATNYLVPGLTNSAQHWWRVAKGPPAPLCGDGPFSAEFTFTTSDMIACGTPPPLIIVTVAGKSEGDFGPAAKASILYPWGAAISPSGDLYFSEPDAQAVRKVDHSTGIISTFAGQYGQGGGGGDGGPATQAYLNSPRGIAFDSSGNLYIADYYNQRIRMVDTSGIITTVAGNGNYGYNGDGIPATNAWLRYPSAVAVNTAGDIFIADTDNCRIRMVDHSTGLISTFAGDGNCAFGGDGGPPSSAQISYPYGVTVDSSGNIFISDSNNSRIRKADLGANTISTVAGTGIWGYNGDGIQANTAWLYYPQQIAIDASGNLFIADYYNQRIRMVEAVSQNIATVAGNGNWGYDGDGGPATSAMLSYPRGIALSISGGFYIADSGNRVIRSVDGAGIISTYAGRQDPGDGSLARFSDLLYPRGAAYDAFGNLFIADTGHHRVRRVDKATGVITTVTGTGQCGYNGDGIPATEAQICNPWALAFNGAGDLFISDQGNQRIRKVDHLTQVITTVAGDGGYDFYGDGGPATQARFRNPTAIAFDASGNLFIADSDNMRIRRIDAATQVINTIAGTGNWGYNGDGIPATAADITAPYGLWADNIGNVYLSDPWNYRVRRVDTSGIISTVAGTGNWGYNGDDQPATSANLSTPFSVFGNLAGDLFITDVDAYRVRRVEAATGMISTVAGNGMWDYSGDGFPATSASISWSYGVTLDPSGNVVIADSGDSRVRKLLPPETVFTRAGTGVPGFMGDGGYATEAQLAFVYGADAAADLLGNIYLADYGSNRLRMIDPNGIISTFAGNGASSESGDSGPATSAGMAGPNSVAIGPGGEIFAADYDGHTVRKIDAGGIISTVAGDGTPGYGGDGSPATAAQLMNPWQAAVDSAGNIYIADTGNNVVRRVDAAPPYNISTVAGNYALGPGFSGDDGPATSAQLNSPTWVSFDSLGNLLIADELNHRIRKVTPGGTISTIAGTGSSGFSGDGGQAGAAQLSYPLAVAADLGDNLYVADYGNQRVRRISDTGLISTIGGTASTGYSGDFGPAASAKFNRPTSVHVTPSGYILVTEDQNSVVREIIPETLYGLTAPPALISPPNAATGVSVTPALNWSASGTRYHIQIATDLSFSSIVDEQWNLATNSHFPALASSTLYFWRVTSDLGCGESGWSIIFSFTTSSGAWAATKIGSRPPISHR